MEGSLPLPIQSDCTELVLVDLLPDAPSAHFSLLEHQQGARPDVHGTTDLTQIYIEGVGLNCHQDHSRLVDSFEVE